MTNREKDIALEWLLEHDTEKGGEYPYLSPHDLKEIDKHELLILDSEHNN